MRELKEDLKVIRKEMEVMKISTSNRVSVPIYHTLDDDGNVIEENSDDRQAISFHRLSVPGGGINLNQRIKSDVAPARKMGGRHMLLSFSLFFLGIIIAVILAIVGSQLLRDGQVDSKNQQSSPSMFNCFRTSNVNSNGTITYSNCSVDTTDGAINPTTGIFTVIDPGIYNLHFQAPGVLNKEQEWYYCTIYVDNKRIVTSREYHSTGNGSMHSGSTVTMTSLHRLEKGNRVYVEFHEPAPASSYLVGWSRYRGAISFSAFKIAD